MLNCRVGHKVESSKPKSCSGGSGFQPLLSSSNWIMFQNHPLLQSPTTYSGDPREICSRYQWEEQLSFILSTGVLFYLGCETQALFTHSFVFPFSLWLPGSLEPNGSLMLLILKAEVVIFMYKHSPRSLTILFSSFSLSWFPFYQYITNPFWKGWKQPPNKTSISEREE